MYIYNWQEKKEENQALEDFCHAPSGIGLGTNRWHVGCGAMGVWAQSCQLDSINVAAGRGLPPTGQG
ncbi:MAG: hypothetical protein ABSG78_19545 [Verrucomicrobiota bacterium]|jgi:hypothetical protein